MDEVKDKFDNDSTFVSRKPLLLLNNQILAQSSQKIDNQNINCNSYECAYNQYLEMLEGKEPINFKKAVFIYENTYLKGNLNYKDFSNYFEKLAIKLKDFIKFKGISQYKTAGHYAIFSYMFEPSYINENQIYKYDFNDFIGDKNWESMFVTKVIKTKKGNCHSLPYFYKIIANELELDSYLAIAPNHMFIKHLDENGRWVNIELTNGNPTSDAWIISSLGISSEAIKNRIYMDALTEKENIALCLWDLAMGYQKDYGYDEFVLKCCNTVLRHYPNCISALLTKFNCLQVLGKKQQDYDKNNNIKNEVDNEIYTEFKNIEKQINMLGFKEMPQDLYEIWLKSAEEQKKYQE